jgi:hypothetical protein
MSSDGIKTYRIYFFNAQNRITDTAVLDCSDDKVCTQLALAMLRDHRDYRAVEIWQGNRKVGFYDRQTNANDATATPETSGSHK